MIKAKIGNLIVLGLSDENIKRLTNKEPIVFNLNELGLENLEVFMFNGKDESDMEDFLREQLRQAKKQKLN